MKLKNVSVIVTIPHFGSTAAIQHINNISVYGPAINNVKKGNYVVLTYEFSDEDKSKHFIGGLEKVFNPKFFTHETKIVNKFDNDWEEYEFNLKNHDWYYTFSDDSRVYHGGWNAERRINELKKKLSNNKTNTKKADSLYKKYAKKVK